MPRRLPIILPLIAASLAAPALAQEPPPCEMRAEAVVDGALPTVLELRAVRFGIEKDATIEGRYTLTLDAASRADNSAPAKISVIVNQMEVGTPDYGTTGFRTVVVKVPGIAGTGYKGAQPTVVLTSGRTALGTNRVSPESDVLFFTHNGFVGQPTTAEMVAGMDLDKRLSSPRAGMDIQIELRDKAGTPLAQYVLPATALREMRDALMDGYGKLVTAVEGGQCMPKATLLGF